MSEPVGRDSDPKNVGRVGRTGGMIQQVNLSHLGAANQAGCKWGCAPARDDRIVL